MTFDQAFIEFVDVSPDGQQLAFSSDRAGNHDIWVMPVGSPGQLRQLTFNIEPDWDPDWSPDALTIAFYSFRTGDREIFTLPAAGGSATQLTRSAGLDATPEWSPNGKELTFRTERTGNSDIRVIPSNGGEERHDNRGYGLRFQSGLVAGWPVSGIHRMDAPGKSDPACPGTRRRIRAALDRTCRNDAMVAR